MDLRNSNVLSQRTTFTLQPYAMNMHTNSIQVLANQVSKNPSICLKILTYQGPIQSYIKS